jgi:epoxide hydrolase-like predicted phosphatase
VTVTAFLFDVGGVIILPLDPDAVWARRDRLAQQLGYASGEAMWLDFYESDEWASCKTGQLRHEEMWDRLLRPHGLLSREQQSQFVDELHVGEGIRPEMESLLATLHGQYKMGILSNWDDRLEMILEELGISHYFDVILNSHRIGAAKPDEAAFHVALQRLEARPEEVLFVDNLERNTRVAAALGMKTHTFTDLPDLIEDLQERALLDGSGNSNGD